MILKKIRRFSVFIAIALLAFLTYRFAYLLTLNDISVEPIVPSSSSENPGIYLISYADGPAAFHQNQHALTLSSLNKGVDFFLNYRRSHLSKDFVNKNAFILNQKMGAGYWLWKPWIILETLKNVPEGAIVIYADSGFVATQPITPLLNYIKDTPIALVEYEAETFGLVGKIAQRETLKRMHCDTLACRARPHLWAGFSIFRNASESRDFVARWLEACQDERALINTPSDLPEHPEFSNHAHDEAILSVLHARHPEEISRIPYKTFLSYFSWHHRHPKDGDRTLLPNLGKGTRKIDRMILNSSLMRWMRSCFLRD